MREVRKELERERGAVVVDVARRLPERATGRQLAHRRHDVVELGPRRLVLIALVVPGRPVGRDAFVVDDPPDGGDRHRSQHDQQGDDARESPAPARAPRGRTTAERRRTRASSAPLLHVSGSVVSASAACSAAWCSATWCPATARARPRARPHVGVGVGVLVARGDCASSGVPQVVEAVALADPVVRPPRAIDSTMRRSSRDPDRGEQREREVVERQIARVPHAVLGPEPEEQCERGRQDDEDERRARRHHPAQSTATTIRNHIHGGRGISGLCWSARKPKRWIANVVTFSYRMLCVYGVSTTSGTDHTAVEQRADRADRDRRASRCAGAAREPHRDAADRGEDRDDDVAEHGRGEQHRRQPQRRFEAASSGSSARASAARKNRQSASPSTNENSPASVLARLPP